MKTKMRTPLHTTTSSCFAIKAVRAIGGFIAAFALWSSAVHATAVYSYSQMPTDETALFPSPFFTPSALAAYGIQREVWNNATGSWMSDQFAYQSGASGFYGSNLASLIAPHSNSISDLASRFTFTRPIYAFGATLVATNYPSIDNPIDSFENNYENVSYQVIAYDFNGKVIGQTESSSYGNIIGPVEYKNDYRGTELMFSFAGLWLDEPIYQLTISGKRPAYDQAILAPIGGLFFSSTPFASVPEPASLALLGLGLVGLVASRHRKTA